MAYLIYSQITIIGIKPLEYIVNLPIIGFTYNWHLIFIGVLISTFHFGWFSSILNAFIKVNGKLLQFNLYMLTKLQKISFGKKTPPPRLEPTPTQK